MSGAVKAIKKVFRKAVKAVKKFAPVILAAAAIYFTVGAAQGVAGTAGGWLSSGLGLSGTLGSVVSGAVTQAGYGALIGGGLAAVTGGDVSKGLLRGAVAGGVTGGLTGAFTAPATNLGAASGSNRIAQPLPGGTTVSGGVGPNTLIGAADKVQQTKGLLERFGDFAQTDPGGNIIGGAIQGLGSGIGAFAQADAEVEAAKLRAGQEEAEREQIAANFGVGGGGGLLTGSTLGTTPRPSPTQQFTPTTVLAKARGAMWRYNPETGQLELTPTAVA